MARARANGIDIEYETFGATDAPPLLLIMGLGAQMISWDDDFCAMLAGRGFHVIRFDNRDAGLSTRMEGQGEPDLSEVVSGEVPPPYTLDDMAADATGLLDALHVQAAHIVGASMGGFIAQLVAINHPARVLSLTSIMSGPGGADAVLPTPEGLEVLLAPPGSTRDERIQIAMWSRTMLMGSDDPFDEDAEQARAARAIDRAFYPAGGVRQLAAYLVAPSRLEKLRNVAVPMLVIHGDEDILLPVDNGRKVAAAVPGARMLEFKGMGHDLPRHLWPEVVDAIADLARQAVTSGT